MCLIHMSLDSDFLLERIFFSSQWTPWGKGNLWLRCHPKHYLALLQHFVHFRTFSLPLYHFSCLTCQIYRDLSHFLPVLNIIRLPWNVLWTRAARNRIDAAFFCKTPVRELPLWLGISLRCWWMLRPFPQKMHAYLLFHTEFMLRFLSGSQTFRKLVLCIPGTQVR